MPARGRRADIVAVDEVVKLTPLLEFIENRWRSSEGLPEREVWIPILAELNAKAEAAGAQDGFSAVLAVHATLAGTIEESPPAVEEPPPTVIETAVTSSLNPASRKNSFCGTKWRRVDRAGRNLPDRVGDVNEIWREQRQKLIEAESAPDDLKAAADRCAISGGGGLDAGSGSAFRQPDARLGLVAPRGDPARILDAAFGPELNPPPPPPTSWRRRRVQSGPVVRSMAAGPRYADPPIGFYNCSIAHPSRRWMNVCTIGNFLSLPGKGED